MAWFNSSVRLRLSRGGLWCHLVVETVNSSQPGTREDTYPSESMLFSWTMALRASEFAGEEKKKKLQREERSTEIKAVLGISEEKRSSDFKSRALIERWLQQINSLTQLNSTSHAITEHIIAVHNSLGGRRLTRKKKKKERKKLLVEQTNSRLRLKIGKEVSFILWYCIWNQQTK